MKILKIKKIRDKKSIISSKTALIPILMAFLEYTKFRTKKKKNLIFFQIWMFHSMRNKISYRHIKFCGKILKTKKIRDKTKF